MEENKENAQTLVIGSLLLLALAVSLIVYAQIMIFPQLNERSEFSQLKKSTDSMEDIKVKISSVATSGGSNSVLFNNRVSYPSQPATPSDQFGQVNIRGSEPIDINFANFGSSDPTSADDHKIISYKPRLVELQTEGRSSVYDNGIVGVTEPSQPGYTTLSSQNIVKDDDVNIIQLISDGDSGFKSSEPTISFSRVEEASTTMSGDGSGNDIEIEFRSQYSQSVWDSQLNGEPNVENVDVSGNQVTIFLDETETYNLEYARVLVSG
jgi:hypothetical protein